MKIRKLFIGFMLLAAMTALLCTVSAETETKACAACQKEIAEYITIGGPQTDTLVLEAGKHYCLTADITGAPESGVLVSGAGCIDLNGFNITAGENCIAISCTGGTTSIMGEGTVTGTYTVASYGAAIHTGSSAVVNLYGGTYRKTGNNAAVYVGNKCQVHLYDGATIETPGTYKTYPTAVFMEQASGLFHMHGGTVIGGTTTGNGGSVRVSNGTFTMDGGTITGGQADRGGNIAVNSSGKLTINGGTITSGTATATYGGGNLYTNKRTVTISGGLITKGTATGESYGGGNIGVYRATLNITGGTICEGVANAEGCTGGGNIYTEGDIAKLNITGGTIADGATVGSGGNICTKNGQLTISGGIIQGGTAADLGGGSIYAVDTVVTMTEGEISGGVTDANGGNILMGGSMTLSGGTVSGGQAARGGNITIRDGGSLIMDGGTVTAGTASQTYGGGNIYTNKCPVTISGGLITDGIAAGTSYGGGNLGIYKATVNMTGGTVSGGKATNASCRGGGNVYMEGDNATFNMTGGLVTAGYIAEGRGHSFYTRSGSMTFGAEATIQNKADGTGGSMNLYLHNGSLESAAKFAGGLYITNGTVSITGGTCYSFYYHGSESCAITGGVFRLDYSKYVPDGYCWIRRATTGDYIYTVVPQDQLPGAVLVRKDGAECYTNDPLGQLSTDYTHVKLYADLTLESTQQQFYIDLNGKALTVTGSGRLFAFDTANDTYNASACGSVKAEGTVELAQDVLAPNGKRYIAINGDVTTMHRLHMAVTTVTLKPGKTGMSYKSAYYCDEALAAKVKNYGVVLSLHNMPGADFMTEQEDMNRYSTTASPFTGGAVSQSVTVANIMRKSSFTHVNAKNGETPIYATAYLELEDGVVLVSDTQNTNKKKTDQGFNGIAYSLHDAMNALDTAFDSYSADICDIVDVFYYSWKDSGMDWSFEKIGKSVTAPLTLQNGQGYCPVCRKKVEWTALDQATYESTIFGVAADGAHIYLAEDITSSGTGENAFILAPATAGHSACLHLNGHNLTATRVRGVYGGQGIINVMGSGTVSGYVSSSSYGAAVQISTSCTTGIVNLYSGTYTHAPGSHSGSYAIGIRNYGGAINVYENAHIDGGVNGRAIYTGTSLQNNSVINLYNTLVDGNIYLSGSTSFVTKLNMDSTVINGTVDANGISTVIVTGPTKIRTLDVAATTLVTPENLTEGAEIAVIATGCFTVNHPQAESNAKYFTAAKNGYKITTVNDSIHCIANYSTELELDEAGNGYCSVCKKNVIWEVLTGEPIELTGDQHVYLAKSIVFEGNVPFITAPAEAGKTACIHLNGQALTTTGSCAILSDCGNLNVMGNGTVTGCATDGTQGAAVLVNGQNSSATVSLYSGTYKKHALSNTNAGAVGCGKLGGTLKLYADVTIDSMHDRAIYMENSEINPSVLNLDGTVIQGSVVLSEQSSANQLTVTVSGASISENLQVGKNVQLTLSGRPVIKNLILPAGMLVTLQNLLNGTAVGVSAEGVFTAASDQNLTWAGYFTAFDEAKWITLRKNALFCEVYKTLPAGRKVMVIGNSMTYYGRYVLEKGHVLPLKTRVNDQGYLYQLCHANGYDVTVTNFTFGGHTLKDFYSGNCAANRGHDGHNHLEDLTDRNYDYVIFQEGSEAAGNTNIYAECKPLMELFLAENPDTKFVFLVQHTAYTDETAWRSSIKELEDNGIIIVDWGAMVEDIIQGAATVPGATQSYQKFSFVVNKSARDGRHPNILAGYIAAQMTLSAITGHSAVGMDYSFWIDPEIYPSFKLSSYYNTYYGYDKTVPSNTNFEAIFASAADMQGLQMLMDQYLEEKSYREN